jgi:hypothetical protein
MTSRRASKENDVFWFMNNNDWPMWQDLNNLPLYVAQFFMFMGEAK